MPFKSTAQKIKFEQLVKEGKLKQSTYDEWLKETPEGLPERVTPKKNSKVRFAKVLK